MAKWQFGAFLSPTEAIATWTQTGDFEYFPKGHLKLPVRLSVSLLPASRCNSGFSFIFAACGL